MHVDPTRFRLEAHHAPPLEADHTFQELMAERLRQAPWLLLSVAIHALAVAVVMMLPAAPKDPEPPALAMQPAEQPPDVLPPDRPDVQPLPDELTDEPELADVEVPESPTDEQPFEDFSDAPSRSVDAAAWATALGLGPGPLAGRGRTGRRDRLRRSPGGSQTAEVIRRGLGWLAAHQDADGKWDADDFMKHDVEGEPCDGPGSPVHDVGLTGLALLAFLGDGSTLRAGEHRDVVREAVDWLRRQQDPATGLFGSAAAHDFVYDHAIATYAMVEAYGLSDSTMLRRYAQRGIDYLESHRNPYMVWRYWPRDGENDTSVTGWCVLAYESARYFGLQVSTEALRNAAVWFDRVTDPATGRCGYTERGEPSSRHPGEHAVRFPPEKGEALTAVGLMCRFFLGQDPARTPVMAAAADTILRKAPVADKEAAAGAVDHYYWYYGSYALYQMGGRWWQGWSRALTDAVVETQRLDGNFAGSWDPVGVWGEDGGRVYSTAMLVLSLEAYYRYTRLVR